MLPEFEISAALAARIRPAIKAWDVQCAQSVLKWERGEYPPHYEKILKDEEVRAQELLAYVDGVIAQAIDANLLSRDEVSAALLEIGWRIEACGASVALTRAVTLCSDLRGAIGDKFNRADPSASLRVRKALRG